MAESASDPVDVVPRTVTPLSEPEMAEVFAVGHQLATGRRAGSRRLLETALAIIGVENANGRAIIQHNWGNISCRPGSPGPKWMHPVPQEGQPLTFRAYPSHEAGVTAWWRLMYRDPGHRRALAAAALGRPVAMVDALYDSHYVVGGSVRGYRRGAAHWSQHYREERLFAPFGPYRADWVGLAALAAGTVGVATIGVRRYATA